MPANRNKQIAKNTLMLYLRMLLITAVSLYTVRIILNELGVEDYGIYSVIIGVVALCSFLTGSMAMATQRFFSFALGENDTEALKKIFTVNWMLYGMISCFAFVILETAGLWFINERLQIPPDRFEEARNLYHLSIFTLIAGIFTSPFVAMLIAHEDMQIYAFISIGEALMKLGAAFLLTFLTWDKLELYGFLLLAIATINAITYIATCAFKYEECQFREFHWDKSRFIEIIGFTGWTLFGQVTTVVRTHAVTILLNQTFNPGVVAARAIATQVSTQVNIFSRNFNTGLYPPIIKAYAAGNKEEMFSYIYNGSKITFFLMWIFALPLFIEMEAVLTLWLKTPPPDSVLFVRLALIEALIFSASMPLTTAARAPGKMRLYELTLGTIQLLILPASWLVLQIGGPAYSVFIVAIVANLIMFFARLAIVRWLVGISYKEFLRTVCIPICGVMLVSAALAISMDQFLPQNFLFVCISILFTGFTSMVSIYFIGLNRQWREKTRAMIASRIVKLKAST